MNHFPISATVEEKFIWDAQMAFIGNPYGVAGLMGNLETKANKLQSCTLGMTDEEFTPMMDACFFVEVMTLYEAIDRLPEDSHTESALVRAGL